MNSIVYTDHIIWWIIPSNNHYGKLVEGQNATSINLFEIFNNESDWINRLSELNIQIDSNEVEEF